MLSKLALIGHVNVETTADMPQSRHRCSCPVRFDIASHTIFMVQKGHENVCGLVVLEVCNSPAFETNDVHFNRIFLKEKAVLSPET